MIGYLLTQKRIFCRSEFVLVSRQDAGPELAGFRLMQCRFHAKIVVKSWTVIGTHESHKRLCDRPDSFGWVSIALHWLTAVLVLVLWFIGKSISSQPLDEIDARRTLHITLALSVWLLLAGRVVWRLWMRHPRAKGQGLRTHKVARSIHYLMLACLTVVLVSGPVLVLSPVLWEQMTWLGTVAYLVHSNTANLFFLLIVVHILGALKHLMFHDDDTIVRMLWPKSRDRDTSLD